jgi:hypothetical protein
MCFSNLKVFGGAGQNGNMHIPGSGTTKNAAAFTCRCASGKDIIHQENAVFSNVSRQRKGSFQVVPAFLGFQSLLGAGWPDSFQSGGRDRHPQKFTQGVGQE